jgi:DNA-binding response OmpR family regulator
MKKLLLVEDNKEIQKYNKRLFELNGYNVRLAMNLAEARAEIEEHRPDAVILDILLPDGNGLDFLRKLRETDDIPVLLLTGLNEQDDIIKGLEQGSDDYLPKPYDFGVLLARVEAILRRASIVPERIAYGSLTIDLLSGQAFISGEDMLLTQKEFALLVLFTHNENRGMSADYLYEKVWGHPMNNNAGALKNQVSNLRKKLEGSGYVISSTRGEGYCFELE